MQFQNNEPIYLQIIHDIKKKIISGEYAPNEQLPPVREFAIAYEVNPNTMQKALGLLEADDLLYTKRTAGRFICGDTERINRLKEELLKKQIKRSISELRAYGLEDDEILALIRKEMAYEHHEN